MYTKKTKTTKVGSKILKEGNTAKTALTFEF
jgi:hypothetical protein